jgi:spermidine synthase
VLYAFAFILAFCSIAYELLLGQSLSAFLGNTVLRYSVTIGLYMLSMGIGALLAEGRFMRRPVTALLKVEVLLTALGGFSVLALLVLDSAGLPGLVFSGLAHLLIVLIGILTGFEIPLLIHLRSLEKSRTENAVLGVDYLGAFFGTVVFAFVFYPTVGLIPTAFLVASLNALVGVALWSQGGKVALDERTQFRTLIVAQAVLLAVLVTCLGFSTPINELFLRYYLRS